MSAKKKTFIVIDGNAVVHRAWHAMPPLSTKDGRIVSGAYGFVIALFAAIKQFSPAYLTVTFDRSGPTFRHKEYKEYKATREKKPDELYAQIPIIERILAAMGISVYALEGFEADDVIGTVTRLANEQDKDIESIIVTGDLDTLQLIDARTKVLTMRKGLSDTVLYDKKAVQERYGLNPDQMIDYKALRGDPSDNIPGVKGIGEKTASELLIEFGSVDKLYASIEADDKKSKSLKAGVLKKLIEHKADAMLAQRLCRIVREAPVDFSLAESAYRPITKDKVADIFEELQFVKLLDRLPRAENIPEASPIASQNMPTLFDTPVAETVVSFKTTGELKNAFYELKKAKRITLRSVASNTEGVARGPHSVGLSDGITTFVLEAKQLESCHADMSALLSDAKIIVVHDAKREILALRQLGLALGSNVFDLMLASYLLYAGERRHTLEAILSFHRNLPIEPKDLDDAGRVNRLAVELPNMLAAAGDLEQQLSSLKLKKLFDEIESPLSPVLADMESAGIAIDAKHFGELSIELEKIISKLEKGIYGHVGAEFNINSPLQLKAALFETLQISTDGIRKTEKGRTLSTAAAELEKLKDSHPIIPLVLTYRELAKLKSTYVDAIPALANPETGRVHAEFNQTVAATGRLSSSNPNMQNIPTPETEYGRAVRDGFIAPKGKLLLAADYSQFELRIAAHIAQEESMIKAFKNGEDIHYRTAAEMFGEEAAKEKRRLAKTINFGVLYGMGPSRLAESADISFIEARAHIDKYFAVHAGIARYIEETKAKIHHDGYVETLFGRRRYFRNLALLGKREQAEAERQAVNMPIQGTQADMIKLAMIQLSEEFKSRFGQPEKSPVRMILQVHDELVFELDKGLLQQVKEIVERIMTGVNILSVPLAVNVSSGTRWGSMEPMK